jgi:hypothetical protein
MSLCCQRRFTALSELVANCPILSIIFAIDLGIESPHRIKSIFVEQTRDSSQQ